MRRVLIYILVVLFISACGSLYRLSSTNCNCVGGYERYELAESQNIFTPDLCYVSAGAGTFIVVARDIRYEPGDQLYLCRRWKSVPGETYSALIYQLESADSKYIYELDYP